MGNFNGPVVISFFTFNSGQGMVGENLSPNGLYFLEFLQ